MKNSTIDTGLENSQQSSITHVEAHTHNYSEIAFQSWNEISKKRIILHAEAKP